ncbi:hypothetical protein [Oceanobacillus sp. CFH 90083]|uniref:hypothetical protein n=1 Tax=Oceanobacillus sp. CFH 90083 TaxID=2592336 RepID=UPI00128AE374|nr:hypothetical protein [Oceanobacillus sp. CFH 90083]
MKKVITGVMPVLLLVLALTFMTSYKQWDDLSDTERYQIRSYVEAAESAETESAGVQEEEQPKSEVASASIEEIEVDPDVNYSMRITKDEETVIVRGDNGFVRHFSMEDWKENQADYYAKFDLDPY